MLSDVMSNLKLDAFPSIAMVLFVGAFVAVAIRAMCSSKTEMIEAAQVPLSEDPTPTREGE